MNNSNDSKRGLYRRDLLKGAAAASLGIATGAFAAPKDSGKPSKSPKSDFIQRENAKPGTRGWLLTKTRTVPGKINSILLNGRSQVIEGYCSANSVRAGEKLQVMVSTNPVSTFKLEIFRTGYYNGDGARLMRTFKSLVIRKKRWSQWSGLNRRPAVYETAALPLSYTGLWHSAKRRWPAGQAGEDSIRRPQTGQDCPALGQAQPGKP